MQTITFLEKILPADGGYYCVAAFTNGLKAPPRHKYFKAIPEMAEFAAALDARGVNVFHACASYQTNESRKQTNTAFMKAFWLDLDVKEGQYPTQRDAVGAILAFCQGLGIPAPMLVSSGRGIHCYWVLDEAISALEWKPVADMFALLLARLGVLVDTTRTADQASVLRPVGTHHRKADPIPVRLLRDADPITLAEFVGPVQERFDSLGMLPPKTYTDAPKSALSSGMETDYPPSSGEAAAAKCPAMAHMRDTQGNCDFPVWRGVIGILKHCTDGEAMAEAWTAMREQSGHDRSDWRYQWDTWNSGPATCEFIGKSSELCKTCAFKDKITSPIQLGYQDDAPSRPVTVEVTAEDGVTIVQQKTELDFPKGFRWNGTNMSRCVKTKDKDTGELLVEWVSFCRLLVQVGNRVREVDGTFGFEADFYTYPGSPPTRALIPTTALVDKKLLLKALASYEAVPVGGNGAKHMTDFLYEEMERRRAKREHVTVRPHLGWQNVDDVTRGELTGEFVFGNEVIRKNQAPKLVNLSQRIPAKFRENLGLKGDADAWVRQVNHVYNRPGAEPWQFAFAVAFGAPLVRLIGGMWHGIPYVLFGETGTAKTTTALVAASIYGQEAAFSFPQQKNGGDTVNASIAKMGAACNLPFVLDELSGRSAEELQTLLYAFSNGSPKDRCAADGSVIDNSAYWDTMAIATTNSDLRETLKQIEDPHIQEALKHRMVQVTLDKEVFQRVFHDIVPARDIDNLLLNAHYGVVGRKYLQLLVNNMEAITGKVRAAREAYKVDAEDNSSERYYRYLVFTAIFGARLAAKAGLISFDIDALERWAKNTIIHQRRDIHDWESNIAALLSSLQGRILVTRSFDQSGASVHAAAEHPIVAPSSTTEIAARLATTPREFWVDTGYIKTWCRENGAPYAKLIQELDDSGYIVHGPGGSLTSRVRLGAGTLAVSGRCTAIQIRYDKADYAEDAPDNVVTLHPTRSDDAAQPLKESK